VLLFDGFSKKLIGFGKWRMPTQWKRKEKSGNQPTYLKEWRFFCRFSFKTRGNGKLSLAICWFIPRHQGYKYLPGIESSLVFGFALTASSIPAPSFKQLHL
jgi:hypothetical protein